MHLSSKATASIKELVLNTIKSFKNSSDNYLSTDIFFTFNPELGILSTRNDDDEELAKVQVEELHACNDDSVYSLLATNLSKILTSTKDKGKLDDLNILKPYSFVLKDASGEDEELLLIDDDLLIVNDSLLSGLDEELDSFLRDLLEEE